MSGQLSYLRVIKLTVTIYKMQILKSKKNKLILRPTELVIKHKIFNKLSNKKELI